MSEPEPLQPDPIASRRAFRRAAAGAGGFELGRLAGERLMDRLAYMKVDPARILDLGCGRGADIRLLRGRYPRARIIGVDSVREALNAARRAQPVLERLRSRLRRTFTHYLCGDFTGLPLRDESIGLAWSNLALSWTDDVPRALREWHRVLEPGGLVIFSTYGPDTLRELRQAFARADGRAHVHRFIDMHDLGDMLLACGFASPVMDVDRITLTYADVDGLLHDLKASGQVNTSRGRGRGLLGRHTVEAMKQAYEAARIGGRIPASVEFVFGHAWKARARAGATTKAAEWTPVRIQPGAGRTGTRKGT